MVIHAKTAFAFELQGYDGLETVLISHGTLPAGKSRNVEMPYKCLTMLIFPGGQKYPIIIGRNSSEVIITNHDKLPSFKDGDENHHFTHYYPALKLLKKEQLCRVNDTGKRAS